MTDISRRSDRLPTKFELERHQTVSAVGGCRRNSSLVLVRDNWRGGTLIATPPRQRGTTVTAPLTVSVEDVCFCHWPVAADALARSVPDWLTVETIDGDAWLTAIPHTVAGISAFDVDLARPADAVTVRTYVRGPDDQRGLYFFAVVPDAPLTAAAAPVLRLPVYEGRLGRSAVAGGQTRRTLDMDGQRVLDVSYTPDDGPAPAPPDSLTAFLVERHRFFTSGPLGGRLVGNVGHDPWPVAPAAATVTSALPAALNLPTPLGDPIVHYSPGVKLGVQPPGPLWLD